jgi:hypothetical protein
VVNAHDAEFYGRLAYEAYKDEASGLSLISGMALPEWEQMANNIRFAWTAAALAVREAD